MAELVHEEESPSTTSCRSSSHPVTIARIVKAIANLQEKGGSTVSSIVKALEGQYGFRSSSNELKQMLIKAVKAGRVKRAKAPNRFIVGIPGGSSGGGGSYTCRRRRRRGGRGSKKKGKKRRRKKGKGKKGKGRGRSRRRRGRGKKKGKGKKGKRRRRRRRRKKGKR